MLASLYQHIGLSVKSILVQHYLSSILKYIQITGLPCIFSGPPTLQCATVKSWDGPGQLPIEYATCLVRGEITNMNIEDALMMALIL